MHGVKVLMIIHKTLGAAALLMTAVVVASAGTLPRCDAKHVGQFWPDSANKDKDLMETLVHSGDLQVCSRGEDWRYRWDHITVSVN